MNKNINGYKRTLIFPEDSWFLHRSPCVYTFIYICMYVCIHLVFMYNATLYIEGSLTWSLKNQRFRIAHCIMHIYVLPAIFCPQVDVKYSRYLKNKGFLYHDGWGKWLFFEGTMSGNVIRKCFDILNPICLHWLVSTTFWFFHKLN